ncbi:MAG TPA: homoserine dehydrogenase, partial [Reyranellaceae bacterium]|nr:homoserine dehydrogenase [Reyranellaceae bacterium]
GLGNVGSGLVKLLQDNAEAIETRLGARVVVRKIAVRAAEKRRLVDVDKRLLTTDVNSVIDDPQVEIVVELVGGDTEARSYLLRAIAAKKHVVTANKALLAMHGAAIAAAAEKKGVTVAFEAAVAGGIPIIKALREGLVGNRVRRLYGILNGTCNYILTTMRETGRDFATVLAEAQAAGYAEADPSFDIDGIDAAHKLAVLTGAAFGAKVNFKGVYVEGIRHVSAMDIEFASTLGYRIKLLGLARETPHGIEQRVHPCMVPLDAPIAHIEGVFNAVVVEGDFVGTTMFQGRGAGQGPTASAVVADLVDIARGRLMPTFVVPASKLTTAPAAPMDRHVGAYYMRLMVQDRPGVIAAVSSVLAKQHISLESMLQRGRSPSDKVPVVLTTHENEEAAMRRAAKAIGRLDAVVDEPCLIRIEKF